MTTLPQPTSFDKLFAPRPNGQIRFATYSGFEGYAAADEAWTILFRTPGSLWYPVVDQAELIILGLVSDAEAQLALDKCAGSYAAICTSRRQEV
jgi:hypothetical protein